MRPFKLIWVMLCLSLLFVKPIMAQNTTYPVITAENAIGLEQIGVMGGDQGRIALSPDNRWLSISGLQGIWIVDLDAGDTTAKLLEGHTRKVNSTAFNPMDSNRLVSVSDDGTIREWNITTGEELQTIEVQETPIFGLDMDSSGQFVAAASGATIRIFNLQTGEQVRELDDTPSGFRRVVFIKDSPLLVGGTFNSSIAIWNLREQEAEFVGEISNNFNGDVQAVRTSPDGTRLAVGMLSGRIIVSLLESGEQLILDYHSDGVRDVAFSPDNQRLASVGMDRKVHIIDVASGDLITEFELNSFTYSVAFSRDNRFLYVASGDGIISTWDIERQQVVQERSLSYPSVRQVVYSPDGRFVAAVTDEDSVGRIFNAQTRRQVAVLRMEGQRTLAIAYRPDNRLLVTGGSEGDVYVWRANNFQLADTLSTPDNRINSLAFTPDPSVLATGSDNFIRLWNLPQKQELVALNNGTTVWSLAVSPDGSLIAAPGGLWNAFTRERLPIEIGEFAAVAISPNSDFLATSDKLTPIEPARVLSARDGYTGLNNTKVAFSPDGSLVAMAVDSNIQIVDVETQTVITTLTNHTADVQGIAFSPDGTRLVSGGFDSTIRQWAVVGDIIEVPIPPIQTDGVVINRMPDDIPTPTVTETTITAERIPQLQRTLLRQAISDVIDIDVAPDGSSAVVASLGGVFYLDLTDLSKPPIAMPPIDEGIFPSGLAVDYAIDGTWVAVSHGYARSQEVAGGGVTLWDISEGTPRLIDELIIGGDRGFSIALSPNKQFIALGFDQATARIIDIPSATVVSETQTALGSRITGINFSPDNLVFTVSDTAGNKAFFNTLTGELMAGFNSGISYPMAWSPDNTYIYSPEQSGFILRDGYTSEPIAEHTYPADVRGDIKTTDVTNGQLVITSEGTIWLLDYQTGDITQTITGFDSIVNTAEVTLDGEELIAVTNDNRLRIWNIETGFQINELELGFIDPQADMAISDDGQFVAIGNRGTRIRILSGETGESYRTIETTHSRFLRFLPDSTILATTGNNNVIELWDVRTGALLDSILTDHTRILDISPNGTYMITRKDNQLLTLQNVRTGTILFEDKQVHLSRFNDADLSVEENIMATAGADGVVKLWDIEDREQVALIRAHDNGVWQTELSPTQRYVATVGEDGVRVYDYRSLFNIDTEYIFNLPLEDVNDLYFSIDGSLLFLHESDTLHVWSMENGLNLANYNVPDGHSVMTADGNLVIAMNTEGSIYTFRVVADE